MKFLTKKRVAVLAVLAVAAIAAVGAYAYFTATGHGTGTFTSGQIGSVTVNSDAAGPLYPQSNPSATTAVQVRVTNNGSGSQYVGQITGAIDPNSLPANCDPNWFTIAPIAAPGMVAAGQEVDPTTTIILHDNGGNQNACANATFTIDWTSAAG